MEHKKRGLALLLALTLPLLCGCEGMVSERPMEDLSGWTIETGADVPPILKRWKKACSGRRNAPRKPNATCLTLPAR